MEAMAKKPKTSGIDIVYSTMDEYAEKEREQAGLVAQQKLIANMEPELRSRIVIPNSITRTSPLWEVKRRYQDYKRTQGLAEATIKGVDSLFVDIYKYLALTTIDPQDYEEADEHSIGSHVSMLPLFIIETDNFEIGFRTFLAAKGLKQTSITNVMIRYAAFYRYCSNVLEVLEPKKFSIKSIEPPIKPLFTDEQIEILLEKPKKIRENFNDYRDWIIINYVYNTGNRRRSVVNIQMKDLYELEEGFILVQKTKNGKPQRVYVPAKIVLLLKEYIHIWRANATPEDYLFCNQYGGGLSPDNLSHIIARYMKKRLGEDAPSSIHLLRHQYAAEFIKEGGSMFDLQKQLGHSSLKMVKWYADKYDKPNAENIEKHSPINRRKQKVGREKMKPHK